jgi:hypothetical protein
MEIDQCVSCEDDNFADRDGDRLPEIPCVWTVLTLDDVRCHFRQHQRRALQICSVLGKIDVESYDSRYFSSEGELMSVGRKPILALRFSSRVLLAWPAWDYENTFIC